MNHSNRKLESSERELPLLDYSKYDRRCQFGPDERIAIEWLRDRFELGTGNGPWPKNIRQTLHRLLQPLDDAFNRIRMPKSVRSFARKIMFLKMSAEQTPFWAWGELEWKKLIQADKSSFGQHYRTRGNFRKYFLPLAYLLSETADLHIFGRFYPFRVANQVFNPEIVKDSIARVSGELIKWGYGKGRITACAHGVTCEVFSVNGSFRSTTTRIPVCPLPQVNWHCLSARRAFALLSCPSAEVRRAVNALRPLRGWLRQALTAAATKAT